MHSKLIVHGDLKLSNIMISSDHKIKLIDFGFSNIVPGFEAKIDMYSGTPAYLAPEIIKKKPYNGSD